MTLEKIRKKIDKLNRKILKNLEKRLKYVNEVKGIKKTQSIPTVDIKREEEIVNSLKNTQKFDYEKNYIENIFFSIIHTSREVQRKRFALIGKNINASLSPVCYEYFKKKYDLNFDYELIDVKKESELRYLLTKLKDNSFDGYNITSPYKSYFFYLADIFDDYSNITQSSNVFLLKDKFYYSYNTDYLGFKDFIIEKNIDVNNKKIIILGNGSIANTIYHYLIEYTSNIVVFLRDDSINFKQFIKLERYDNLEKYNDYDIVINATSIDDIIDFSFIKDKVYINVNYKNKNIAYDNIKYFNGLELLINQAIYNVRLFLNLENFDVSKADKLKLLSILNKELKNE